MLARLPLDLSTLSELRKQKYLYVDKTKYAYDLLTGGRRFFLSRPRRFGKTLFVSTLKEILLGNSALFENLWISTSDYHWQPHGLINLDLSTLGIENAETLKIGLRHALMRIAREHKITIDPSIETPEFILYDIANALKAKFGRVALLIDEYDNPILHALKDLPQAHAIRDGIGRFFASIKGLDADLDFLFITGVSNFAKAGIFSGLNNLQVITLDERFAAVCGYTEEEITHHFQDYLQQWAQKEDLSLQALREQIKQWYNGYRFSIKPESVYNPFSFMKAVGTQSFQNFWFQSGAPTFLIKELEKEYRKKEYSDFHSEHFEITQDSLGIFDIGATPLPSLMFQTGYLTITDYDRMKNLYTLGYPNFEVKTALQKHILASLARLDFVRADKWSNQLKNTFNTGAIEEAVTLLRQLFANVPYQLHIKREQFYHALLQIAFDASGITAQSEYSISNGRIDLMLDVPNYLYIIEVKFNQPAATALEQIERSKYYQPFMGTNKKPVILLGLSFHREPGIFDITYESKPLT